MNEKTTFLTPEGLKKLKDELEYLRTVRRQEVAERIHAAKEDGDVTDSAGYEDAKNEQAFIEGRILTLESLLQNVTIIEEGGPTDTVHLGTWVTVAEGNKEPETFHIVGSAEADPSNGCISNESPVGKALLGHRVGDEVAVETPNGLIHFKILEIR
ncbi:MAG: transcription elongation factor GreA [Anaerolineae bacterium]